MFLLLADAAYMIFILSTPKSLAAVNADQWCGTTSTSSVRLTLLLFESFVAVLTHESDHGIVDFIIIMQYLIMT